MKSAAYQDVWRHLLRDAHGLAPLNLSLAESEFGDVILTKPVTVVAGLNGAGKSRLLKAIRDHLGEGARLIPVHSVCDWLLRDFAARDDVPELAEESAQIDISDELIETLESIVGRKYDRIEWRNLDIADSPFSKILGDDVVPFFSVQFGGHTYDLTEMGLGELSVHVVMWLTLHLERADPCVLLFDEPDAFIPPVARAALLDHFALLASKGHVVVVTSHSQEFIRNALSRRGVLAFAQRSGTSVSIASDPIVVREIVNGILYRTATVRLIAYVEDEAAYILTDELLKRVSWDLWRSTALYWMKGTGSLAKLQELLPRPPRAVRDLSTVFIVDGEQATATRNALVWPTIRLPGGADPDDLFSLNVPGQVDAVAAALGKPRPAVEVLLQSIAGKESHDWTTAFLEASDLERQAGLRVLASILLDGPAGATLMEDFRRTLLSSGLTMFPAFVTG